MFAKDVSTLLLVIDVPPLEARDKRSRCGVPDATPPPEAGSLPPEEHVASRALRRASKFSRAAMRSAIVRAWAALDAVRWLTAVAKSASEAWARDAMNATMAATW